MPLKSVPLGKACRLLNHGPAVIVLAQHGSRKSRNKAFSIDKQKRPITGAFLLWSCCILLFALWARLLTQLRTETLKALEVSCPDNIQCQSNDCKNNQINQYRNSIVYYLVTHFFTMQNNSQLPNSYKQRKHSLQ